MCGIIGEISNKDIDLGLFLKRRDLLSHRGPDSSGYYFSEDKKIALGHRRLSIIDLSERGNQPMRVGNYIIVFNGEVYNFKQLKTEAPAEYFSATDTEVILRLFIKFGADAFRKLDGMFAIAIYDMDREKIILARDRMGVKPLYYFRKNGTFKFASEIQCIEAPKKLNLAAVNRYLFQNYIYGNETIMRDVYKLRPGSYGIYDIKNNNFASDHFWQPKYSAQYDKENDAIELCEEILQSSVRQSLVSDVPVGVFLSSGIDSSLLAALCRKEKDSISTYNIGFEYESYDESGPAQEIADRLGTKHHSIRLSKSDVLSIVPKVLASFDEPSGNSSAISTFLICQYASQQVKVCLAGDGADEIFAGYPIYYLPPFNNIYRLLPGKKIIERIVNRLPVSFSKMSFDYKLKRFVMAAKHPYAKAHFYYRAMNNHGILEDEHDRERENLLSIFEPVDSYDKMTQLLHVDQQTILVDDYLARVDRMSMANSLEVRVPYLNNDVVEFAHRLAPGLKIKFFETKYVLKKILEKYLPDKLIYRKKMGFNNPIGAWLRDELKPMMLDILGKSEVDKTGLFNYNKVERMISDHMRGRADLNRELWGLINLVYYVNRHGLRL